MPYDLRIMDLAPVAMNRVNVRMTNPTIMNLDCHVFPPETATLELQESKRTSLRISRHPLCGIRPVSVGFLGKEIHYCGVCHSDIHTIHGDWGKIHYPQIV